MEIQNEISNNLTLENEQNKFLDSTIGKVINNAIDIGLRYVLPDLIEEEVIDVKNALMTNGLKEGVQTAIDNAVNLGKSAVGIVTGSFENISQVRKAIEKGGVIDAISDVIDFATKQAKNVGLINRNTESLIKAGKNSILNNVSSSIEKELTNQEKNIEEIADYSDEWSKCYKNKDFDGMQEQYVKIEEKLNEVMPIEETIKKARTIETLHNLIKNNGQNFDLSKEELEVAYKLS